jgi:hypothetical protein
VILGIGGFACYFRVRRQLPAFEDTLVVILLRFVTKNDDDAAGRINGLVVVVVVFGGGDAISGDNERGIDRRIRGEADGHVALLQPQVSSFVPLLNVTELRSPSFAPTTNVK